ncbi:hypothetical protein [Actinokineospora bangkokensis]|uniref:Polysaccharide chain length determinant N-terminal domain-containing protein n=1 Tax=Actinokineospora bangkokensis TaxID=1193682 RepID=A0A1Q9LFI3_9PSEU|nr:hypothetical protein [Actinokineospora bangkokensis]OLR90796.1 hypothetical protein BJP25_29915 [Actinokineospora bangkokensis]
MDFWKTVGVLLKRWPVALAVFGITLGIAGAAFAAVPTEYESKGLVILTVPTSGATVTNDPAKPAGQVNPLLAFDGSLQVTSQLLVQTLNDPKIVEQLAGQGATADYQAGDGSLDGPFIMVIADGTSPDEAQRTVSLAFDRVREELTKRQTGLGAPTSTFINMENVVAPTPAEPKIGGKVRAAGAAFALGVAASLTSVYMLESRSRSRARRGTGKAGRAVERAEVVVEPEPTREEEPAAPAPSPLSTAKPLPSGAVLSSGPVPAKPVNGKQPVAARSSGGQHPAQHSNGAQHGGARTPGSTGGHPQPQPGDPNATRRMTPVKPPQAPPGSGQPGSAQPGGGQQGTGKPQPGAPRRPGA